MSLRTGLIATGAVIFIFFVTLILLENRAALKEIGVRLDDVEAQVTQLEKQRPAPRAQGAVEDATKRRYAAPGTKGARQSKALPKLEQRIIDLEERLEQARHVPGARETDAPSREDPERQQEEEDKRNGIPKDLREKSIQRFKEALAQDRNRFGADQIKDIERLYGDSIRETGSEESRSALQELMESYPEANRTGCAALRMAGEMLRQDDDEQASTYLRHIIDNDSDAVFRNGVAVRPDALLMASGIAARNGDNALARQHLRTVIEKYDGETDARDRPFDRIAKARLAELGE